MFVYYNFAVCRVKPFLAKIEFLVLGLLTTLIKYDLNIDDIDGLLEKQIFINGTCNILRYNYTSTTVVELRFRYGLLSMFHSRSPPSHEYYKNMTQLLTKTGHKHRIAIFIIEAV